MAEIHLETPEGVSVGYSLEIPPSELMRGKGFERPCVYHRRRLWLSAPIDRIRIGFDHGREERVGHIIIDTPDLSLMGETFEKMAFRVTERAAEHMKGFEGELITLTAQVRARPGVEVSVMSPDKLPTPWVQSFADWDIEEVEGVLSPAPALVKSNSNPWIMERIDE